MPSPVELDYFLANAARMRRPDQDAQLVRLHRVSVARKQWDDLTVLAFDHRIQFFDLVREVGAAEERLPALKRLLVTAVAETEAALGLSGHTGVLIDDRYGQDALNAATGRGWWVGRAIELPLSNPLEFECGRSVGSHLVSWLVSANVWCNSIDDSVTIIWNETQVARCMTRYS
jgi:5-dehydro-2-deoxygluconokinase